VTCIPCYVVIMMIPFFAYSVLCSSYYYDVFCAYERHVVGLELDQ
jgi:hypothetical protein